jgi:hypothetical protein
LQSVDKLTASDFSTDLAVAFNAKTYDAVCTPDFFGYNANLELQYRGRIRELKDLKLFAFES